MGLVKDGISMQQIILHMDLISTISTHKLCLNLSTGSLLQHKVQFVWVNQEDDAEVNISLLTYTFDHIIFTFPDFI